MLHVISESAIRKWWTPLVSYSIWSNDVIKPADELIFKIEIIYQHTVGILS